MVRVNARVDHSDEHVRALRKRMRLRQAQLGEAVLGRVAAGRRLVLLQGKEVVRLCRSDEPIAFQGAYNGGHRTTIRNAPAIQRRIGQLKALTFDARQPEPTLQCIDLLGADRIGKFDHDFVRHESALAGRRCAARPLPVCLLRPALVWQIVINDRTGRRIALRHRHDDPGDYGTPTGAAKAATTARADRPADVR